MCKLMLTAVAQAIVQTVVHNVSCQSETNTKVPPSTHNHAVILQQALHHIPNPNSDCMLRTVASRLAQHLLEQVELLFVFVFVLTSLAVYVFLILTSRIVPELQVTHHQVLFFSVTLGYWTSS